ncbi:IS66 family transposase [Endozoicomonas euniceicola]|uniref:IS66 family transposase n=1 Tax=Endozoicomonas euniceicola TaxID=1234143 RepID=A0ABY6GTB8_9GAMM|nr:IS66 family transposase [Endozoicomonas euniceicola]UYM14760.1 IS66 family transposase [Endozoicomonas euniceicola]UYM15892.1 IS66 family transposase [Endozoicomonas euniceicola]UYM16015.1 IS66 family transposase [Endozoicomonas euniceicola]
MKTPFAYARVTLSKMEYIELKAQANQWHSQWLRARQREREALAQIAQIKVKHQEEISAFQVQIDQLKNQLAQMQHLVFGRSTEKTSKKSGNQQEGSGSGQKSDRKKGQQKGSKGHGRKNVTTLPVIPEDLVIPDDEQHCTHCGLPFSPFPGTEDSDVIEVEVQAHVRRYRRHRYQKTCQCSQTPGIITAPEPAKLIRKGKLGVSVWVEILLHKYAFGIPINRQLQDFRMRGLDLSQGTVTGGLQTIKPLFEPIVESIRERVIAGQQWHADETRWMVWSDDQGAKKHWLWVFMVQEAVYYSVDDNRSARVPKELLGKSNGILVCDRYCAYKSLANENPDMFLAFCWSHVRRDFINAQKGNDELEKWSATWVNRIGKLYHLNDQRLEHQRQPEQFFKYDKVLKEYLGQLKEWRDKELERPKLKERCQKVLTSLKNHWEGLTLFADYPEVPMDNNAAERSLRNPIVGRKNYYGAGSDWSGELMAWLFSVFMTLNLWGINPWAWMTKYLQTCADNGRVAPDDLSQWLPWLMTDARLKELRNHSPPCENGLVTPLS